VSESLKIGTGTALFDFFAESVALFCKEQNLQVSDPLAPIPMGFTFSFPCYQTGIASGISFYFIFASLGKLMKWTKGFNCSGVEGEDVVQLMQKAFIKKGLNILIKALVNDTVGTLVSHAYVDPQTYISVILGTGTNAAYVERGSNVKVFLLF
jgi:hexokinase